MNTQSIHAFAITVPDYDDAIDYYCGVLGFELIQDTRLTPDKRWLLIRPKGAQGSNILLARAASAEQSASIGNQTGAKHMALYANSAIGLGTFGICLS